MQFTAQQIAAVVGGTIHGNADASVYNFGKIEEAKKGDLCFLANPKYENYIYITEASIAIVSSDLELKKEVTPTLIRVTEPYRAFATLLSMYEQATAGARKKIGIETPSYISDKAKIGENVYIGAFCYIEDGAAIGDNTSIYPNSYIGHNARVGNNTTLFAGVKIYHDCKVGNSCTIHAGTVIGSDGFGFAPTADMYQKVPQLGNVIIEDDVEMGANCCIDRATMGSTIIHSGVKMDNLIQIAHNVSIGENTVMAGLTAVSGSTKIGKSCIIGGQSGFVGHITIADKCSINGRSGVSRNMTEPGQVVTGSPAFEYKNAMKSQVVYKNLPKLQQRINELEQALQEIQAQLKK
jgi:UDP-3-O-[3-hydroxymyristoyl] glucosamine N-acyltransferase